MSTPNFVSYGQNREDVVLWRALRDLGTGRYVEIGANDPELFSITKSFYDRGWSGLTVEPDPDFAARLREARSRDTVVEAAVTSADGPVTLHRFAGTGLSTSEDEVSDRHQRSGRDVEDIEVQGLRLDTLLKGSGFEEGDIHFVVIDVEGAEAVVLDTIDLASWRPWVLVVEATEPLSVSSTHRKWEPGVLEAGYELCLFDGVSRFYVAQEHAAKLKPRLSYPACALDDFVDYSEQQVREELASARTQMLVSEQQLKEELASTRAQMLLEILRWRHAALGVWAGGIAQQEQDLATERELNQLRQQLSQARRQIQKVKRHGATARPHAAEAASGSTASSGMASAPGQVRAALRGVRARTLRRR